MTAAPLKPPVPLMLVATTLPLRGHMTAAPLKQKLLRMIRQPKIALSAVT